MLYRHMRMWFRYNRLEVLSLLEFLKGENDTIRVSESIWTSLNIWFVRPHTYSMYTMYTYHREVSAVVVYVQL